MNEQLRAHRQKRTELLRDVNQRLETTVRPIAQLAEELLRFADLPEDAVNAIEVRTGRTIRRLAQNHIDSYMATEGVRGIDIAVARGIVLDVESTQLFDVGRSERNVNPARPLSDIEWFRNWEEILAILTSLKFY